MTFGWWLSSRWWCSLLSCLACRRTSVSRPCCFGRARSQTVCGVVSRTGWRLSPCCWHWQEASELCAFSGEYQIKWTYIIKKQLSHQSISTDFNRIFIQISLFQFLLIKVVATDEAIEPARWSLERSKVDAILLFFRQLKRFYSNGVSCYRKTALM